MDVTPLVRGDQQIIQNYAAGQFKVSGISYDGAVLVSPMQTIQWGGVSDFKNLTLESFEGLLAESDEIDVLLLGAGKDMAFLDIALKNKLSEGGLAVDVMPSDAACRTYNVLMAEGRRVVAALLPVI